MAANLGDDADTAAAIYGQITGAHYGVEAIPTEWRARLTMAAEIVGYNGQPLRPCAGGTLVTDLKLRALVAT